MTSIDSYRLTDSERERISKARSLTSRGSSSVAQLIAMLTDASWVVRREVVQALSRLERPAVEALRDVLLHQRDSEARIAAAVDALVASLYKAEPIVTEMAGNPDPAIVADVVQILGRRKDPASVPTLIELTMHSDDNVAVGALEALGRIGGRAAVEALIATTKTGNFFRTFPAIDILGRSSDPRVIDPLTNLLANPSYLPEAARALGRTGERAAAKPLIALLAAPGDSVARLAAISLNDLRERAEEKVVGGGALVEETIRSLVGVEALRRLIRIFPSADVAETAAFCKLLGAIGDVEAASVLSGALDGPPSVATSAADALKRIGKDAEDQLLQAIRDGNSERRKVLLPLVTKSLAVSDVANCLRDPEAEVRALACDSLARIGNGTVVPQIFKLLSDPNVRVVHAATSAIQALGTREARTLAREAANSESAVVRRSALRILGYFGDAESLSALVAGLKDADPRVREAALQGLPYIEDSRAIDALIGEAKSPDPRSRGLALRALGQLPKASERVYSLLLKALTDVDPWVRYYACQSLGRLGFTEAASDIAKLFADEAGQVRVSAVEALSHLRSPEAHAALRKATDFEDVDVRRAAIVGLGIAHRNEDLPIVLAALKSPDSPTRLIALSAIVNFHSPLVMSALGVTGADGDEQVRSAAIAFLAARPEHEATEVLVELLSRETTREAARTALVVPTQNRIAGLLTALHSAGDELAPLIVSVLSRIERPDAKAGLLAAMKLTNAAARKAAASAIAAQRGAEMRSALEDAAENDPDAEVRKICTLLLRD